MSAWRRPRVLSLSGWSGVLGASRSKMVELLVQNAAQVAGVAGLAARAAAASTA